MAAQHPEVVRSLHQKLAQIQSRGRSRAGRKSEPKLNSVQNEKGDGESVPRGTFRRRLSQSVLDRS